jgi:hypothetical protein
MMTSCNEKEPLAVVVPRFKGLKKKKYDRDGWVMPGRLSSR